MLDSQFNNDYAERMSWVNGFKFLWVSQRVGMDDMNLGESGQVEVASVLVVSEPWSHDKNV
jgi:hypothetical protein